MAKLNGNNGKIYEKVGTTDAEKDEKQELPKPYGYGVRHVQALLIFATLCFTFISRAHLSVTIVAMTDVPTRNIATIANLTESNSSISKNDKTNMVPANANATNMTDTIRIFRNGTYETLRNENQSDYENLISLTENGNCPDDNRRILNRKIRDDKVIEEDVVEIIDTGNNDSDMSIWNVYRTYDWPKSKQEMVLGAFFLGYLIMMTPMGMVAQRWGGKLPLQISLFSSAFLNFFTPWLAVWGDYKAVSLSRTVMGLCQAGSFPSVHSLISQWVPLSERGRISTFIYAGSMLGIVLSSHVSGLLAASVFGWPSVFWVIGVLCLIMAVLLTLFGAASPHQHPGVSQDEKNYILGTVQEQVLVRRPTPWKAIFTSMPVLGTFLTHMGTSMIYLFFFTQTPTYLHQIVGLDIKNSGLLSSLPYLGNFLTSILIGILCDYCINNNIATIRVIRIISNSIATLGSGVCLIAVSFTSSPSLAVFGLVLGMILQSGAHTGWMMSYIDLAPNFSGTLVATGNTLLNMCACLLPILVSHVVTDVTNVYQWRIVMFVVTALGAATNTVYIIFVTDEVLPWNDSSIETSTKTTDEEGKDTKSEKEKS